MTTSPSRLSLLLRQQQQQQSLPLHHGGSRSGSLSIAVARHTTHDELLREAESLELQAVVAEREGDDGGGVQLMERALQLRTQLVADMTQRLQQHEEKHALLQLQHEQQQQQQQSLARAGGGGDGRRGSNAEVAMLAALTQRSSTALTTLSTRVADATLALCEAAERLIVRCNTLAARHFKTGDFATAEPLLEYCLQMTSDDAQPLSGDDTRRRQLRGVTLNNLGCMHRRRGHFTRALQCMQESMTCTATESPVAYMNMSAVLTQLRLSDEAAAAATRAVALLTHTPQRDDALLAIAHHNLAMALEPTDRVRCLQSYAAAHALALRALGSDAATTRTIARNWARYRRAHGGGGASRRASIGSSNDDDDDNDACSAATAAAASSMHESDVAVLFPHPFLCSRDRQTRRDAHAAATPSSTTTAATTSPLATARVRALLARDVGSTGAARAVRQQATHSHNSNKTSPAAVVTARATPRAHIGNSHSTSSKATPMAATAAATTTTTTRSSSSSNKTYAASMPLRATATATNTKGSGALPRIARIASSQPQQQQQRTPPRVTAAAASASSTTTVTHPPLVRRARTINNNSLHKPGAARSDADGDDDDDDDDDRKNVARRGHGSSSTGAATTRAAAAATRTRQVTQPSPATQPSPPRHVAERGRRGGDGSSSNNNTTTKSPRTSPSAPHLSPLHTPQQTAKTDTAATVTTPTPPRRLSSPTRHTPPRRDRVTSGTTTTTTALTMTTTAARKSTPPLPQLQCRDSGSKSRARASVVTPPRTLPPLRTTAVAAPRSTTRVSPRTQPLPSPTRKTTTTTTTSKATPSTTRTAAATTRRGGRASQQVALLRAVCAVQRRWRVRCARRQQRVEREARRAAAQRLRRNAAARVLQRCFRQHVLRRAQAAAAAQQARQQRRQLPQHVAAVRLQCMARCWLARRAARRLRRQQQSRVFVSSLLLLQRCGRAYNARRDVLYTTRVHAAAAQRRRQAQTRCAAATVVQRAWRARVHARRQAVAAARDAANARARAAVRVQCWWRLCVLRRQLRDMRLRQQQRQHHYDDFVRRRRAALTLQSYRRMLLARRATLPLLTQARLRAAEQTRRQQKDYRAVCVLQRAYRCYRARRRVAALRAARDAAQQLARASACAVQLQRVGRGAAARAALAREVAARQRAVALYRARCAAVQAQQRTRRQDDDDDNSNNVNVHADETTQQQQHRAHAATRLPSPTLRARVDLLCDDEAVARAQWSMAQQRAFRELRLAFMQHAQPHSRTHATHTATPTHTIAATAATTRSVDAATAARAYEHVLAARQSESAARAASDTAAVTAAGDGRHDAARVVLTGFVRMLRAKRSVATRAAQRDAWLREAEAVDACVREAVAARTITRFVRAGVARGAVHTRQQTLQLYNVSRLQAEDDELASEHDAVDDDSSSSDNSAPDVHAAPLPPTTAAAEGDDDDVRPSTRHGNAVEAAVRADAQPPTVTTSPAVAPPSPTMAATVDSSALYARNNNNSSSSSNTCLRPVPPRQRAPAALHALYDGRSHDAWQQRRALREAQLQHKLRLIDRATSEQELTRLAPRLRCHAHDGHTTSSAADKTAAAPPVQAWSTATRQQHTAARDVARVYRGHVARKYVRVLRALRDEYLHERHAHERYAKPLLDHTQLNEHVTPPYTPYPASTLSSTPTPLSLTDNDGGSSSDNNAPDVHAAPLPPTTTTTTTTAADEGGDDDVRPSTRSIVLHEQVQLQQLQDAEDAYQTIEAESEQLHNLQADEHVLAARQSESAARAANDTAAAGDGRHDAARVVLAGFVRMLRAKRSVATRAAQRDAWLHEAEAVDACVREAVAARTITRFVRAAVARGAVHTRQQALQLYNASRLQAEDDELASEHDAVDDDSSSSDNSAPDVHAAPLPPTTAAEGDDDDVRPSTRSIVLHEQVQLQQLQDAEDAYQTIEAESEQLHNLQADEHVLAARQSESAARAANDTAAAGNGRHDVARVVLAGFVRMLRAKRSVATRAAQRDAWLREAEAVDACVREAVAARTITRFVRAAVARGAVHTRQQTLQLYNASRLQAEDDELASEHDAVDDDSSSSANNAPDVHAAPLPPTTTTTTAADEGDDDDVRPSTRSIVLHEQVQLQQLQDAEDAYQTIEAESEQLHNLQADEHVLAARQSESAARAASDAAAAGDGRHNAARVVLTGFVRMLRAKRSVATRAAQRDAWLHEAEAVDASTRRTMAARRVCDFLRRLVARRTLNALRDAQRKRLLRELAVEEMLNEAATAIQRAFRGHLARRYVHALLLYSRARQTSLAEYEREHDVDALDDDDDEHLQRDVLHRDTDAGEHRDDASSSSCCSDCSCPIADPEQATVPPSPVSTRETETGGGDVE